MDIVALGLKILKNQLNDFIMNSRKFISNYVREFCKIISLSEKQNKKITSICSILLKLRPQNSVHIFGNGGSASIASHFSMDLTNNSKIKCFNYNDPAIISCFSNDFGFQNWISRAVLKYGRKNDVLILISSSGKSKNMINGIKEAKKKKFKKIISFTGFDKKNFMTKNSDINFWVDCKKYNIIENTHQFYLLMIVDLIKKLNKG